MWGIATACGLAMIVDIFKKGDLMLVHWVWLAQRSGVSDRVKLALLERLRDAEDIYHAGEGDFSVDGLSEQGMASLLDKSLEGANKILAQCAEKEIKLLTFRDGAYPARLRSIPDPPMVLYYKGRLPDFGSQPVIGVVGTRRATTYGLNIARRMGYQIARCGGVLVSGMAFGIDGVATGGALEGEGIAVGVLGCGVDKIYPLSNRTLFARMERQGCLISEFPPRTPPAKWNFPRRNRIISGLSDGVLVVEAPERSGALITARLAAEQGRDVFVVPGNIDVAACAGSNGLLRDGAAVATTGWDILSEYAAQYPGVVERSEDLEPPEEQPPLKVAQKPRIPVSQGMENKKRIDNGGQPPYIDGEKAAVSLSEEEQRIVRHLERGRSLTDDVIAATGLPSGQILGLLTMLEVRGIIRRLPGNMLELK